MEEATGGEGLCVGKESDVLWMFDGGRMGGICGILWFSKWGGKNKYEMSAILLVKQEMVRFRAKISSTCYIWVVVPIYDVGMNVLRVVVLVRSFLMLFESVL